MSQHSETITHFLTFVGGGASMKQIAESTPISLSTVKKNMKVLIADGIVIKNGDGLYHLTAGNKAAPVKAPAKKDKSSKIDVSALVDAQAAEVNEAMSKPRTASGKPRTEKVLGFRKGTRAGDAAERLLKDGTITQPELSKTVTSTTWINRIVKWGYAKFDKNSRTVTLTAEGKKQA